MDKEKEKQENNQTLLCPISMDILKEPYFL